MSNKIILCSLLLVLAVFEVVIDYNKVFSVVIKKAKDVTYRATGIVDKMFVKDSLAKYSNIFEKNVFNPSVYKHVILKTTMNKISASKNFSFDVRGVTITPDNKYVLLWNKEEKTSIITKEGENVKRWKIVSIFKDRIIVGIDGAHKEIYVNKINENE